MCGLKFLEPAVDKALHVQARAAPEMFVWGIKKMINSGVPVWSSWPTREEWSFFWRKALGEKMNPFFWSHYWISFSKRSGGGTQELCAVVIPLLSSWCFLLCSWAAASPLLHFTCGAIWHPQAFVGFCCLLTAPSGNPGQPLSSHPELRSLTRARDSSCCIQEGKCVHQLSQTCPNPWIVLWKHKAGKALLKIAHHVFWLKIGMIRGGKCI